MVKNNKLPEKKSKIDDDILMIETEEINYDLDSDPELESNHDLIKFEFNMIELPFFTKDKNVENGKARKYIFSEKAKSYMRLIPGGDKELISNKIPQEFDEKIFYGILKLSKEQNSKEVVTDYFTLAKASQVLYNHLDRIKDSLERLRRCTVEMNNLFYDAESRSKFDGKKEFNLLQNKEEYTFKKIQELKPEKREKYKKFFRNSKISEILVLTISDPVYKNIERKGFLYFDTKNLLDIESATARKLFMLITKWHGWEKKPVIKRSCRFLASRIPLSWEKNSIRSSVCSLENACLILKNKSLIQDFILTRTKPADNSYIEFVFARESSRLLDYNIRAASTTTGHEGMIIDVVEDEFLDERQLSLFPGNMSEEDFMGILLLLPEKYRTQLNMDLLKTYSSKGREYLITSIEYAKKNCKENFDAYIKMTLEKDWARGDREHRAASEKAEMKEQADETDRSVSQKEAAEKIYSDMSEEDLGRIHGEAEGSMYYKFTFKDKVDRGEIDKKEALKEVSLVLISGKIEKDGI